MLKGLKFRAHDLGFWAYGLRFMARDLGFGALGLGLWV